MSCAQHPGARQGLQLSRLGCSHTPQAASSQPAWTLQLRCSERADARLASGVCTSPPPRYTYKIYCTQPCDQVLLGKIPDPPIYSLP